MDDLYDNLENYQDENIIHELKTENADLKRKLEENSSAMLRLQNDFDKLNSEYKKLEMNYSSLLKTARAEIERKAEMIKSLNSEKDQLIIKSLQRSNHNIKNPRNRNMHGAQQSNKRYESDTKHIGKPQPEPQFGKENEEKHKDNRILPSCNQSEDRSASVGNKFNFREDKDLKETYSRNKTDKSLSNITRGTYNDDPKLKTKVGKISNRRKSMPMSSRIEPIFSSDDDFEALNMKNIRKSPSKDDARHYDRYSNKDNYYHSTKDRYSKKSNRFSDYKNRHDRYDPGSKYARHSPEKCHDQNAKDYSEMHKSRNDYQNSRQRIPSPPSPPKFSRSKSRDRRNLDRENIYEKKKQTSYTCDNSAVKHKIRNELEEPVSKRLKTEIVSKVLPENIYINDKEKEMSSTSSYINQQDYTKSSCQSPDYINIESTGIQHITKEIKHTSVTPQEDPRLASKKYVLKNTKKENVLSTAVSEYVDIKPVNVAIWDIPNIKKFMISETLTTNNLPVEINKKFMGEVQMDVDNPILNDSLESGEILSEYDSSCLKDDVDKIHASEKANKNKHKNEKLNNTKGSDSNKTKSTSSNKYKIPKIKKPDTISIGVKHDSFKESQIKKSGCTETKKGDEISNHSTQPINIENISPIPINVESIGQSKHSEVVKINDITELPKTSRDTLADDLQLSDEESRDIQKDIKISKDDEDKDTRKKELCESKEKSKPIEFKKVTKDSRDNSKTRKSKKKSEQKQAIRTEAKDLETIPKPKDKLGKPSISIETKNKFSDLFGDSSSLITPDDLGIPPANIQLPIIDKYTSMFENTQDAVDICVEEINKAKCKTNETANELSNNKTIIENVVNGEKTLIPEDECVAVNNVAVPCEYENVIIKDDSEAVSTVIISSGAQPKYTPDTLQSNQKVEIDRAKIDNSNVCMLKNIQALATSTPLKPEFECVQISRDPNVPNNDTKITENSNLSATVNNSSNPDEISQSDVPDVRLIVRRRRKIVKKS